ncbi:MAG: hypothetical protein R3E42_00535 [Burkholderiaceae bacterium]
MPLNTDDTTSLFTGAWEGRNRFAELVREALSRASEAGWPLLVLSDPNFADWPLGESGVVDALGQWARQGRQLHFLARDYRVLRERAPRLVQWRVSWDHVVEARVCRGAIAERLPSALWTADWSLERLDLTRSRGVASRDSARSVDLRERLDACWQQGAAGFPATVLGL